jgi:hypothetical protein
MAMRRDMRGNIAERRADPSACPRIATIDRRIACLFVFAVAMMCSGKDNQVETTQDQEIEQAPKPALPLIALLAMASALGVAVAVALAGVAMLLAAPAYADEGTLLLERRGALAEAELVFADYETREDGQTRVVEAYENPYAEPLAGVYLFRLPPNAVLEHLRFSASVQAQPALHTLRQGAALVERTAEIGPGETLVVELEYRLAPRSSARLLTMR